MPAFHDIEGRRREATTEAMISVLRSLGAPVEGPADLADAVRFRRLSLWERLLPPCLTVRAGLPVEVPLRMAAGATGRLRWMLRLEEAPPRSGSSTLEDVPLVRGTTVEGGARVVRLLRLAEPLPVGYHRLELRLGPTTASTALIVTPDRAHGADGTDPLFGLFHPLYGLRDARGWGAGDLGTLREALQWVAEFGGDAFGTLPLFATFAAPYFDPDPYRPVSRRFWSEMWIEPERAPGATDPAVARALVAARRSAASADRASLVEHGAVVSARGAALDVLSEAFYSEGGARDPSYLAFLASTPLAPEFARFQAGVELWGSRPDTWPEPARGGSVPVGMVPQPRVLRHLYAQWVADTQVAALAGRSKPGEPGLYLDLPVGTHPDGFDVWREGGLFARDASVGAPPDPFAAEGQDWGFPPVVPEASRRTGHRYFAECIRQAMRPASWVRVDHVMGLQRLYWVPHGFGPEQGVYVRYPAEELAAVLVVESHRAGCEVFGEDLGTVAPELRRLMDAHGLRRSYVLAFSLPQERGQEPDPVPEGAVATPETHDMYPFAALLDGGDIRDLVELGRIAPEAEGEVLAERSRKVEALLDAVSRGTDDPVAAALAWLGRSPARLVLAPVDDLASVREPQNVPGSKGERPNWRRRLTRTVDDLRRDPVVRSRLQSLAEARTERG